MPKIKWNAKDIPAKARAVGDERTQWTFEGIRGLTLDCLSNGERLWKARYQVYVGGKRVERKFELGCLDPEARRSIGDSDSGAVLTPGQARDRATAILARVDAGGDPWLEERTARRPANPVETFATLYADWLERHSKVHNKSWQAYEGLYNRHIDQRLGALPVAAIDRRQISAVLDDIAKNITGLQANKCQTLISSVFSWALDEGRINAHPSIGLRRRGEDKQRDRIMSDAELRKFWSAISTEPRNIANALRLLTLLGGRLAEVAEAEQDELALDTPQPTWTLPARRVKNARPHVIPLPPKSVEVFRSTLSDAGGSKFVFPAHRGHGPIAKSHISRQFQVVAKQIGMHDIRLHDQRHTVATNMAIMGIPLDIRQLAQNQISGRRQAIGSRYDQHDYAAEKRRAFELWEGRLLAIVEGRSVPTERW